MMRRSVLYDMKIMSLVAQPKGIFPTGLTAPEAPARS
jgi:hypothetical protein